VANCCVSSTKIDRTLTFARAGLSSGNAKMMQSRKSEKNAVKSTVVVNDNVTHKKQKQTNKKQARKRKKLDDELNADEILQSSYNASITPTYGINRFKDNFYDVPCEDLAKGLLGKILVRRLNDGTVLKGRIVETECYPGGEDRASCSRDGRITENIKAVYMKPGTAFVYSTYGMYHCFNISSQGQCKYQNLGLCSSFHLGKIGKGGQNIVISL
jgi:DNA-3-methyladenine glycosylase